MADRMTGATAFSCPWKRQNAEAMKILDKTTPEFH